MIRAFNPLNSPCLLLTPSYSWPRSLAIPETEKKKSESNKQRKRRMGLLLLET